MSLARAYPGTPVDYWLSTDDRMLATAIRTVERIARRYDE